MKRIFILMAILALSSIACADPTADSLCVSSASGDHGGSDVLVLINITNVVDGPIQVIMFDVTYDSGVIQLVNAGRGFDLPKDNYGDDMWTATLGTNKKSVTLAANNKNYSLSNGTTGNIAKLYFNVVGTAGQTSPIELSDMDIVDTEYVHGTIPAVDGTFTVTGDVTDPVLCTTPDPASHNFGGVPPDETRTWTFDVTNCGAGTLDWTVADDQDWIAVSPESGSDADTVTVTIDTTGLADGAYGGTVTVSSSYGTKTGTIDVTVQSAADPSPTLTTYTISNTTISPNGDGIMDDTEIDVEFSETIDTTILIENTTGIIRTLYTGSGVTDPDPETWNGIDDGGNIVADGAYHVNITMDDGVNPAVYDNTRSIMVANMSVATISIGNGSGIVTIPIAIEDGVNVGACDITLTYNVSVVNVTNVTGGDMDATFANLEHRSEGWVRIGTYQTTNPGLSGQITFANVTFEPVGGSGGTCSLNLSVTTFKDTTPVGNSMPYVVRNGTYTTTFLNGDVNDDGIVDIHDAMYLAKYELGEQGYDTINEEAADVNGDGGITSHDAMCLAKHVIGISGYAELQ
jgi:hypothetical protein